MKTWTIIDKLLSTSQEKGHCFRIFLWDWTSSLCYSELVHRIMDLLFQSSTKITKYIRTNSWGQQSKMFYMESMYIYNALPLAACAGELWNYLLKEKTKTAVMQQRWTMEKVSLMSLDVSPVKNSDSDPIMKTCLYNFDPLKPHFYTVKLGFTGVYIIFLILLRNIDCGYSLELPHWESMFWAGIWKLSEFFILKFSFYGCKIFNIFEKACFRNACDTIHNGYVWMCLPCIKPSLHNRFPLPFSRINALKYPFFPRAANY